MKFCKHCGVQVDDHTQICPNCGTALAQSPAVYAPPAPSYAPPAAPAAPAPAYASPVVNVTTPAKGPITEYDLPPRFKPLGAWTYFGYNLLFSIPIVGLILLIVFSFSDENINRRNYARSFFCGLVVALAVALLTAIILAIAGVTLSAIVSDGGHTSMDIAREFY